MAHSTTTGTDSPMFQARGELSANAARFSEAAPGRADFEAQVETYRGFVLGMGLAAAHALVILLLLFWFLM